MIRKTVAAAALLAATSPLAAARPADFKAKADAFVAAAYPADGPGAVVLITDHGRPVYRAARGLADVKAKTPITDATVFRYGSITKQFAAATLMKYVERGQVRLDDKLSKYVPDYPMPGADVTVRQLLTHTSGIASYTGLPGWMEKHHDETLPTLKLVDTFKDAPLDFAPGSDWRYNNSGYILVGAVIEKVSGKPWAEAVRDEVFKPLGLASMQQGTHEAQVARMAKGYGNDGSGVVDAPHLDMTIPGAAGALIGTADDLARWANALHHGKVVGAASYAAMTTPVTVADGSTRPYGFGLELGDLQGRKEIGHSGGIFGFATDSVYIPQADLFVTVLANSDSPTTFPGIAARKLAALALGTPFVDLKPVPLDVRAAAALTGVYSAPDATRTVTLEDGKLYWARGEDQPKEMLAAGKGRYFFGPNTLDWVEFKAGANGQKVAELHQGGAAKPIVASWTKAVAAAPVVTLSEAQLGALAGTYDSPMGPVVIARDGGVLTLKLGPQSPLAMKPLSTSEFAIREVGAKVAFNADGLVISQGGRDLPAKRVK